MPKIGKRVSSEERERILKEQELLGCSSKIIASKYDLSAHVIRNWKYEKKLQEKSEGKGASKFIELEVEETANAYLEKVSLVNKGMSVSIAGRIKSSSLIAMIRIMEEG